MGHDWQIPLYVCFMMAKTAKKQSKSASRSKKAGFISPPTTSRRDYVLNGSDDWFRDVIYRLVQALGRLVVCREAFGRELGLTGSQFAVLFGVAYRQGENGISIAALSTYIGLAATHVTTEVGRMIRKGLLVKLPNQQDRRSVLISLSPEGEKAVMHVLPMVRQINDILFRDIDRKQLDTVNMFASTLLTNSEYALAEIRVTESARAER
ncbi:MarR family transcriptional regulator [Hyphomicrobiales bacterium]|nr:MarR family transcriptional regulator [Hyphomicrobiales bacterium]CAH1677283.1 MarR family transcriptional regulator [Hyphomicrobiales bacterium]